MHDARSMSDAHAETANAGPRAGKRRQDDVTN
jgi:hypothetical protein